MDKMYLGNSLKHFISTFLENNEIKVHTTGMLKKYTIFPYLTASCTYEVISGGKWKPTLLPDVGYGFGIAAANVLNIIIVIYVDVDGPNTPLKHLGTYTPSIVQGTTKTVRLRFTGNIHYDLIIDPDNEVEDINQLLCVCQTKYDDTKAMIECCNLECSFGKWFHYECLGIPEGSIADKDAFYCVNCSY